MVKSVSAPISADRARARAAAPASSLAPRPFAAPAHPGRRAAPALAALVLSLAVGACAAPGRASLPPAAPLPVAQVQLVTAPGAVADQLDPEIDLLGLVQGWASQRLPAAGGAGEPLVLRVTELTGRQRLEPLPLFFPSADDRFWEVTVAIAVTPEGGPAGLGLQPAAASGRLRMPEGTINSDRRQRTRDLVARLLHRVEAKLRGGDGDDREVVISDIPA